MKNIVIMGKNNNKYNYREPKNSSTVKREKKVSNALLGYTISAVVLTLGSGKGLLFVLSYLFLQNIIFIPSLFALTISGTKLYKAIMQDRRKENIKIEIYKHSMFSIIILVV